MHAKYYHEVYDSTKRICVVDY